MLAAALGCPVYTMACLHQGDGYRVAFEQFAERIVLPRGSRDAALAEQAQRFARWLELQVIQSPLDWFNFFPSGIRLRMTTDAVPCAALAMHR